MIHIIVGSTLGGTEYVAEHLAELFEQQQFDTKVHFQPDINNIPTSGTWLIITSTHGAGEYPDNLQPFITQLSEYAASLSLLKFGVIGIGDSSYDTFCAAAKQALQLLIEKDAHSLHSPLLIDIQKVAIPEDKVSKWFDSHWHKYK